MTDPQLPDSSELTKEAFTHSGWREIIGKTHITDCSRVYRDFEDASTRARNHGNLAQAKVLLLLAGACSIQLTNKSRNEPYEPMWVWNGRSSPTPDWFSESDIDFLADILANIDEPMLEGRLADLLWLKKTPYEVKFALEAIDSYRSLDLNAKTWPTEIGKSKKRALVLTKMIGQGSGHSIEEIEADLRTKFMSATKEDKRFAHWLAETLKEFGLGRNHEENIADRLESLAHDFELNGDFYTARDYYSLAGEWFGASGQDQKQIDMKVATAEGWAKEAKQRMSSDNPSALAAADFYDNALQIYREIPRSEREAREIGQRIDELIRLLEDAGQLALGEMTTISTAGIDIGETVEKSRNAVSGREPTEALNGLVSLHRTDVRKLRKQVEENLKEFPFTALVSRTVLSHDGRVAAKSPGIMPTGSSEENEPTIWAQMIQDYGIQVQVAVLGCILPALEVMHVEHRFREADFILLARNSPAVPPGREQLFGKALFNGYEQDFATALHLLTPQIENMVRYRLKGDGVITTHTDHYGIEDEKGLSSLVETQEFERIFGENLVFEIKALFCDHSGANLKNNVSHGLLTQEECHSIHSIYAWWLGLKIVFRTYSTAYQSHTVNRDSQEDQPEGEADRNQDRKE